jgi:hypothetical protein
MTNISTSPLPSLPLLSLPFDNNHQSSPIYKATRVTQKFYADYSIDWPLGAIVEYPRTMDSAQERILHIFHVDPTNPILPQRSFLYGFGSPSGMHEDIQCYALTDCNGAHPRCQEQHLTCGCCDTCKPCILTLIPGLGQGMKVCEFSNLELHSIPHSLACHDMDHQWRPIYI